jgi:2-polyprenyl-6-methoxyphenol hydroxylase-like FAD-dependent oxidoreductase
MIQVGSGPAGLALALSLLKNGTSVRIVEKDEQHHHGERGAGIMVGGSCSEPDPECRH